MKSESQDHAPAYPEEFLDGYSGLSKLEQAGGMTVAARVNPKLNSMQKKVLRLLKEKGRGRNDGWYFAEEVHRYWATEPLQILARMGFVQQSVFRYPVGPTLRGILYRYKMAPEGGSLEALETVLGENLYQAMRAHDVSELDPVVFVEEWEEKCQRARKEISGIMKRLKDYKEQHHEVFS